TPYRVYGGFQDSGTWGGPSRTDNPAGIVNGDWSQVLDLDGFHCQVPPDDPDTLFAEGQYGRLHRIDLRQRRRVPIRPGADRPAATAFRFNWSAPLVLSAHDPRALYFGGNVLFKSPDRGASWRGLRPGPAPRRPGPRAPRPVP